MHGLRILCSHFVHTVFAFCSLFVHMGMSSKTVSERVFLWGGHQKPFPKGFFGGGAIKITEGHWLGNFQLGSFA